MCILFSAYFCRVGSQPGAPTCTSTPCPGWEETKPWRTEMLLVVREKGTKHLFKDPLDLLDICTVYYILCIL